MIKRLASSVMVAIILLSFFNCVNLLGWVYQDNQSGDYKFEVFGPRADKLLIKLYANKDQEWNALANKEIDISDSLLTQQQYDQFTNTSLADQINVVKNRGSGTSLYILDINNNNDEFLGNPPNSDYPNPVYPNPCSVLGMRKAIAYLCNRTYLTDELVRQYEFDIPTYTCVPSTNPYAHPDIAPGKTREDLCYPYSRIDANASLDSSGFASFDSEGWRIWNVTGDRVVLRFFIRNNTLPRFLAGNLIADELEACGVKVERVYGNSQDRTRIVMEQKNFHLYTGGWIFLDNLGFMMLWNVEWYSHPGTCSNYDGCNNTDFNVASAIAANPKNLEEAISAGRTAQEAFAENVLGVPLWSSVGYTAMNRRYCGTPGIPDTEDSYEGQLWEGACPMHYDDLYGQQGADNIFSFMNMHPQGFPAGTGNMTVRYGFCQNWINSLNPIYPSGAVETKLLSLIGYESLLRRDPYNYTLMPWIVKSFQEGTYEHPGLGNCSKISFTLRTDVQWSDGQPLTVDDVFFSLVELPRLLQGRGFPIPDYTFYPLDSLAFKIIDPYNFEILYNTLSYWDVATSAFSWILPAHVWRQICQNGDPRGFQPDANMVATGPWRMTELVQGDHILLTKNANSFKTGPIDCVLNIGNAEAHGNIVPPGTNVQFSETIANQCYNATANINVQTYVDHELHNTTQITLDGKTSMVLGPFLSGPLQKGNHEIEVVLAPETPDWMSQFSKQYVMPVYVTYPEDLNLDFFVNVQECVEVGNAFGTLPAPNGWDPKADLWPDYKIDIKDVVLAQKRAINTEWQAPLPQPGLARLVIDSNYTAFSEGAVFNVTVSLENALDVAGYQFALSYDTTCLDLIGTAPEKLYPVVLYTNISDNYSPTIGRYTQSANRIAPEQSFTGNSPLVTLTFNATKEGFSYFNLTQTLLADSGAQQIPHVTSVALPGIHDVAILDVRSSKNVVEPGEMINIQVTTANYGNLLESFEVTAYADADTSVIGDETLIGTRTVALPGPSNVTLDFSWDSTQASPGNLTISAKAHFVLDETNTTNNVFIGGSIQVLPKIHDVAVTGIRSSQDAVYIGDLMNFDVDVQNQGNVRENVNVTLYADANTTIIGDELQIGQEMLTVDRFGSARARINWDTIGAPAGNYTITAVADPILGEVDLEDNSRTYDFILLFQALPCPDVNVTCPGTLVVNPSIFTYDPELQARLINIGNVSILSTGFQGGLRVVGSHNGTIRLCVDQPNVDAYSFNLTQYGEVQVPLWLVFQPETHWGSYDGTYTLNLTVCGTHRRQLTIKGISIVVCQNGAYIVNNETVSFSWNLTGGSLVYLEAEPDLPSGWTYTVDPPVGSFFETPQIVNVNITAPPDAKEGDMGKVTLRAYKNSTGQMIWQFIYFAYASSKPPTIESVTTPTVTPDGQLLLNATVSDPSGIMETVLHYSVDFGEWQNQTMQWMSGDTLNTTLYSGTAHYGTGPTTVRYYVSTIDWLGKATDSPVETIEVRNDIAITGLTVENAIVSEINHVQASITVRNNGTLPLSFTNVAVYANSTLMGTYTLPDLRCNEDISLNTSLVLPKGNYIITAYAASLPDEVETSNNARMAGVYNHYDIATSAVAAYKTVVGQDYPASVDVSVENRGNFTETFNVTAYANTTIIGSENVTLPAGNSATVTFTWDTTGFAYGNYTISAHAWPVGGETNTGDNTLSGGTVIVSHMGDITGDGKCDIQDLARVSGAFGSLRINDPQDPNYGEYRHPVRCVTCPHTPNADITNDGKVDIQDLARTSANFGWHE